MTVVSYGPLRCDWCGDVLAYNPYLGLLVRFYWDRRGRTVWVLCRTCTP